MPRAMTSRSILSNQISTWLSQDDYVGLSESGRADVLKELADHRRFVGGEIVEDDVNRLSRCARGYDLLQEG